MKGCLLFSGWVARGSLHDATGPVSPTTSPNDSSDEGVEIRLASEWTRVEGTYGLLRPLHGEDLVYIYRQTTQRTAISPDPWEPISVSRVEFPDMILEDMALFFADIHVQWREVSWWLCRIHHASTTSALPILSAPNYVVVTERDYEAFGYRPHGLVELVFGNSHVFAACLPRWLNWPLVLAFLEPITHTGHFGIQMMGLLNGERLNRRLVRCYDSFFVQVFISASPFLLSELFQNAPLVADTLHMVESFPVSERTHRSIVYIAGGYSLILSRCFLTAALHSRSELIQGIRRRFPDLAMENFGLAEVHPSMQTIDPVANSGTLRYVVIPAEEDYQVYIALELNLPPYHKTGSISVPPHLHKARLIAQTGINIVCGPTGELCLCYHNGWELHGAQEAKVHDGDFIICWLDRDFDASTMVRIADDLLPNISEGVHPLRGDSEACGSGHLTDSRQ